jgi:acetyl esterase/lipase
MFGRLQGVCYKQEWFALFHPSVAQYDDGVDYHLRPYWCSKLLPEGSDHQFPVERIHQLQCWFRDNSRQSVPPVVIVGDDDDLMIIDNATGSALLRAGGTTVLDNGAPGRSLSSRRPLYKAEDIRGPNEFFDFIGEVS